MSQIKLTAGRVNDFVCPPGRSQAFLWDSIAPGLALRVTAAGVKAYIFQARLNGKTIRTTIGDPRTWPIDAPKDGHGRGARQEANRLQHLINEGTDPRKLRAEQIVNAAINEAEVRRKSVTFGDAWPVYIASRRPKWGERSFRDHVNIVANIGTPAALHAMLPVKLCEFSPELVGAWLEKEAAHRPTQAALAFRLLRAFLNWCELEKDYRNIVSPTACGKTARIHLPKNNSKTDCLQKEQLPGWFSEVRKIDNPVISAYLQSLLLTGARRDELGGLTWECLDFKWKSMTIRDKVDGVRVIPLTPYVSHLLNSLPRRNEWVFSSLRAKSGRLQEARIQHNIAVANAGLPHLTINGLRRSFNTLSGWIELPVGISAQIMGHKPSAIAEKHYNHRPLDLLRMWHVRIEKWLLKQSGIVFNPSNVPNTKAVTQKPAA